MSAKPRKLYGRKGVAPELLQCGMKKCGEVQLQLHSPFISTLGGDKWSDSRPSGWGVVWSLKLVLEI